MKAFASIVLATLLVAPVLGQTKRTTPARPAAKPAAPATPAEVTEPAMVACPNPLGTGTQTKRVFCDVLIGRDPMAGIIVTIPPHSGAVTLAFDLHNRHIYSDADVREKRSYRRYTASIGVLAMDNTLLSRAFVQNEFRTAADLFDRIGGSGPAGLKAVAPTGVEPITIMVEEQAEKVSILGEKLLELRPDGRDEYMATGRPIAIISNVTITYKPPAAKRPATRRR